MGELQEPQGATVGVWGALELLDIVAEHIAAKSVS